MKPRKQIVETLEVIDDGCLPKEGVFACQIDGWDFEPFFHDGDYLLFTEQDDIETGQIGAYEKDGVLFVKQKGDGILRSLNIAKPDIPLSEDYRCLGKLLGKAKIPDKTS